MRLADYVISRVQQLNVKNVYGVTGRGSLFLSDAVAKNRNLRWIAMHHEQSAGFAAIAESQFRRSPSVALVSSGCASTNLITPVLLAWQDFIATIFISGQHFSYETQFLTEAKVRTFGQQETEIVSIVKPITKWASMITEKDLVEEAMDQAFDLMLSDRKGPIWIDIPLDLQSANVHFDEKRFFDLTVSSKKEIFPNTLDSRIIKDNLGKAQRPMILIGSGVESAGASHLVQEFAERHKIPIVYANTAVDSISSESVSVIGALGSMGCSRAAAIALKKCDFLLVLGHRLGTPTTGPNKSLFAENAKVCVVDIDFTEIETFKPHVDILVRADIKLLITELMKLFSGNNFAEWLQKCVALKNYLITQAKNNSEDEILDLYELCEILSSKLPRNAVYVTDSGYPEIILPTNVRLRNGQRFLHPASQGSMGYALPAAIAASNNTDGIVCAVVGDGSIMMNIQELQTISHLKLRILVIVINNDAYGIIRKRQDEMFRGRTIGTHHKDGISCPDFEKVAEAFQFNYRKIKTSEDLVKVIDFMEHNEKFPFLVEVNGLWDQTYPRIAIRANTHSRVARLEDQEPFLDLEVLEEFLT